MDREKEWSLIIEDANTRLHLLFKNAVILKQNKFYIKSEANRLFSKVELDLKSKQAPNDLISKTVATMQRRFVDWYNSIIRILEKEANSNPMIRETIKLITQDYKKVINKPLKESNAMIFNITDYDLGSIDLKDSVTTQEYAAGQAYMDDYVKTVKKAMKSIAGMNLVMRDKNGRKLSVRNLAEMTARFENTKDRLKELKDKGIEFVVASSHANSSARCQIWQGKIFKLDVDPNAKFVQKVDLTYKPVREGVIDGLDYYSLKEAMARGFLGYNCRHRLVKYTKGMSMFNEYPANRIEKERNREIKQRELERKIRNAKKEAYMAATPEDRKKWTEKSKMYQEEYHNYCKSKGLVEIPWRTQISRDERSLNIDFDGNELTYGEFVNNDLVDTAELREKYKIFFQSHIKELRTKVKDGTIMLEECSNPLLYDENHKVRNIYHNNILELKEELTSLDMDLESKALYAFSKRNEIRNDARELMVDVKAKIFLEVVMDKDITFEKFINDKMFRKELTREQALEDTIKTSTDTNDFFDKMFI